MRAPQVRVGFVIEQAMGHLTHRRALATALAEEPTLRPTWIDVPYYADDLWQRLPVVRGNPSLRLSARARTALRRHRERFDALVFHTQVTSLFSLGLMQRVPSLLSLDATPLNVDPVPPLRASRFTRRPESHGLMARLKQRWTGRTLATATAVTTWNEWSRNSLIHDYGVPAEKIHVIPPGVDLSLWRPAAKEASSIVRLLFVGGQFERKGGHVLMEACTNALRGRVELDIVSSDLAIKPAEGVRVHRDLAINSDGLRDLYSRADLFVLPSFNDCTPLAILEAMASGLPVVASDVGAIREQVEHGVTGLLVRPGDAGELATAIGSLIDDPSRRIALGRAGRARAEQLFDADRNYRQLLGLIRAMVSREAGPLSTPCASSC